MSYEWAREEETWRALTRRVEDFVGAYRAGRPTVVLLPGAMGSHLDRSDAPYVDDRSVPFEGWDAVWIDLGLVFGDDLLRLTVEDTGHDRGGHLVVPDGPLHFFVTPYDGTARYFREREDNFIVFGFDWRRPLGEAVALLHRFLARLRERVLARRGEDPLPRTTLVAHSLGGLVATAYLHEAFGDDPSPAALAGGVRQVVTVGTPFYGSGTHLQRYYVGQWPLELRYGRTAVAAVCGSLPGPYVLIFLDETTYRRDGARLGLRRYPLRDGADRSIATDPHDPRWDGRLPPCVRRDHLAAAREARAAVTRPLPAPLLARMFHVRSVANRRTPVELSWDAVDGASYDPDADRLPLSPRPGPGDGTVPAWSARLAQTPDGQVYDLTTADEHDALLEHVETLRVVGHLVDQGRLPPVRRMRDVTLGVPKARRAEVLRFVRAAAVTAPRRPGPGDQDPRVWRALLGEAALA